MHSKATASAPPTSTGSLPAPVGRQVVASVASCDPATLDDPALVERALREASRAVGATVVRVVSHRFEPQGLTAVALLSESHAVLHTWPERRALTFDLFSCAEHADLRRSLEPLLEAFGGVEVETEIFERRVAAAPGAEEARS